MRLAALAVATFALAVAACGGDDAPKQVSAGDALADPCRLLTAEEVEDSLGAPVSVAERRGTVGALGVAGCEYAEQADIVGDVTPGGGDTGRRPKAALVLLGQQEVDRALESYRDDLGDDTGADEPVDALGDEAFIVPPHETLVVRRGELALVVDVAAYLHAHGPGEAERLRADARELAALALERLDG